MKYFAFCLLACFFFSSSAYILALSQKNDFSKMHYAVPEQALASDVGTTDYEALSELLRGYLDALDVKKPTDIFYCYGRDASINILHYYLNLATISANTNVETVGVATAEYLSSFGEKLSDSLISNVEKCLQRSKDFKRIVKVLGVDPTSQQFATGFVKFFNAKPGLYQAIFNNVYTSFQLNDFDAVGSTIATYHKLIANFINPPKKNK